MRTRLTKQEKSTIKSLFKAGKSRLEIAKETGISYHNVVYWIPNSYKKKTLRAKQEEVVESKDTVEYWKTRYNKALALLIENDLIQVEF